MPANHKPPAAPSAVARLRVAPWALLLALAAGHASAAPATRPANGPWTVRVLVLRYFPVTPDGKRLDVKVTSNVDASLDAIRRKCDRMTKETAAALEEGSRFRAYNNPLAKPGLKYEIVADKEYLEPVPHHPTKKGYADDVNMLEAVHNHIHQIEAVMRHHGRPLWPVFEGRKGAWRAGNCHFPPNAEKDYDWGNKRFVDSDIEDWRPEGFGRMKRMNSDTWDGDGLKWFIYWMRSIPGAGNGLAYQGKPLTNWWVYFGDYDLAVGQNVGLYEGQPPPPRGEMLRGR